VVQQGAMASRLEHSEREPQIQAYFYGKLAKGWRVTARLSTRSLWEECRQLCAGVDVICRRSRADPRTEARPARNPGLLMAWFTLRGCKTMFTRLLRCDWQIALWTYIYPWTEKHGLRGARDSAMGTAPSTMGNARQSPAAVDAETRQPGLGLSAEKHNLFWQHHFLAALVRERRRWRAVRRTWSAAVTERI